MDYTTSPDYVSAANGQRMHQDGVAPRTRITAGDHNSVIWSLMEIVKAAGLVGIPFDATNPESYQLLFRALGILFLAKSAGDDMTQDILALEDALANLANVAKTGKHADLIDLQGGIAGEQFHLNQVQMQSVMDMASSIEAARLNANATSLRGMTINADGAAPNYTIKTRDSGGGVLAVDFVPIDQIAMIARGQQRYLRTESETLFGTQYFDLGTKPQASTDPFQSHVNASTGVDTDNLISRHIGVDRGVPYVIEAGTWEFDLWTKSSASTGNTLKIALEKFDEATGSRTPIITAGYTVSTVVMSADSYAVDVPRIDLAATERVSISFFCFSASNNRTITLNFGGGGFQSAVTVPDVLDHDELSNAKGSGLYHLSQAAAAAAEQLALTGPYVLPPATGQEIGGVKVGGGLSVGGDGLLSCPAGEIGYITAQGSNANGNWRQWSDGSIEQWGFIAIASLASGGGGGYGFASFPVAFPSGRKFVATGGLVGNSNSFADANGLYACGGVCSGGPREPSPASSFDYWYKSSFSLGQNAGICWYARTL